MTYIQYPLIVRILAFLIGLSAAYFIFDRDFYLPFLGKCVIPIGTQRETKNLKPVVLKNLPPNTNVIFWAAKGGKDISANPFDAYGDYANSGIAKTNGKGEVIVEIACPVEYNVSKFGLINKTLKRHIHYRYELPKYRGMFSKVHTKYLQNECT
jgi:hypothetical protein